MTWETDAELLDLIKSKLFTAVVGDVMDELGYQSQFLPPLITGIRRECILIGRAMTVLEADEGDCRIKERGLGEKAFGLMFEALDSLKENEVYVCSGSSPSYALWGEMMSTRAIQLKAAGAILNGYHRDENGVLKLEFPCFSMGAYAQDQKPRGKVIDYNCELTIGNVVIQPGDLVFGDRDGVLCIPRKIERKVIAFAWEKSTKENQLKFAIEKGMSAVEAYKTFGIM